MRDLYPCLFSVRYLAEKLLPTSLQETVHDLPDEGLYPIVFTYLLRLTIFMDLNNSAAKILFLES